MQPGDRRGAVLVREPAGGGGDRVDAIGPAPLAGLRDGGRRAAAGVLVVAFCFSASVAVLQWQRAERLAARETARGQVARVAASFGEALLSYSSTDPGTAEARVLSFGTDNFARAYTFGKDSKLQAAIAQVKASASARTHAVYLADVAGDRAEAVVELDTVLRTTAGVRRGVADLELTLLRERGRWKVDGVRSLAGTASGPPTPGGQR